jgi:hypothetical protein
VPTLAGFDADTVVAEIIMPAHVATQSSIVAVRTAIVVKPEVIATPTANVDEINAKLTTLHQHQYHQYHQNDQTDLIDQDNQGDPVLVGPTMTVLITVMIIVVTMIISVIGAEAVRGTISFIKKVNH